MVVVDLHTKLHIPSPNVSLHISFKLTSLHGHYVVSVSNFTKLNNLFFLHTLLYFISGLRIKLSRLKIALSPFCMTLECFPVAQTFTVLCKIG